MALNPTAPLGPEEARALDHDILVRTMADDIHELGATVDAIVEYVRVAQPLIAELAEAMPQLRQLAKLGEAMSQGGLGGLMAAMRA